MASSAALTTDVERDPALSPSATARVAIYCRISRDKEGGGLGVGRQEADCRDLIARTPGMTVVDVYVDNDISAYSGKRRPDYERLCGDLERGVVDTVVCWHTDRLHRRPTELEEYIALCEQTGVRTHCVKAGLLDLSTSQGRMIARIAAAVARQEVEHAIERIERAKDKGREQGHWLGGRAPFGFSQDGKTSLKIVHDEAEMIRDAAADVLDGASVGAIARRWNAAGATTRGGRAWSATTVRATLSARRNGGRLVHRGEDVGEACWTAILGEDTYEGIRAVLNHGAPDRQYGPRTGKRLLTGVARCGICGEHVTVSKRQSKASDTVTSVSAAPPRSTSAAPPTRSTSTWPTPSSSTCRARTPQSY